MIPAQVRSASCVALAVLSTLTVCARAQGPAPRFGPQREMMPELTGYQLAIAAADVDGDGDTDLAIGGSSGPRLLRNEGYGRFVDATEALPEWTLWSDDITSLAFGDVDGDGDLDLFATAQVYIPESGTLDHLYLNDGRGAFNEEPARLPGTHDHTNEVDLVDIDGDGDLDAVLCNLGWFDSNRILVNDGAGWFSDESDRMPRHWSTSIGVADVDGDGDPDLLLASSLTSNPLLLNDGTGNFVESTGQVPIQTVYETRIELVDIDQDGDADALLGSDENELLWLNDGQGTFTHQAGAFPVTDEDTRWVSTADVDGDLDLDVLWGGTLYLNDGSSHFSVAPEGTLPGVREADDLTMFLDVDGDLDMDLAIGGRHPRLLLKGADLSYLDVSSALFDSPAWWTTDQTVAQLDGDDAPDLVIAGRAPDPVILAYMNDGTGVFERRSLGEGVIATAPVRVAVGDFDADGDTDILGISVGESYLCRNDGAGEFDCRAAVLPGQPANSTTLAVGDLDLDGDLDVLLGSGAPDVLLYTNDGHGSFTRLAGTFPTLPHGAYDLKLADVDGDQDLDVLVVLYDSLLLHLNDGAGGFTPAPLATPDPAGFQRPCALGDVDADGDPDLVTLAYQSLPSLWRNDGSGRFLPNGGLWPDDPSGTTGGVELADLDQDGDVDIVFRDGALFVNDGHGGFEAQAVDFGITWGYYPLSRFQIADLDLDGDLDVLFGQFGRDPLRYQLERQLARRAPARLGKPLELELHGPAHGHWLLIASRELDHVPLGDMGVLRLARQHVVFERSGQFDEDGVAYVERHLPADPGLEGLEIYWQALVFEPRRFTNLERTRISAF